MKKYLDDLSFGEINELLKYDPDTGGIRWRDTNGFAGCIDPSNGYRRIGIKGKSYRSARIAWLLFYGCWPYGDIDHINHVRHDDRISNLRVVDNPENHKNKKLPSNNTSGLMGITFSKKTGKWISRIRIGGKLINLGEYGCKYAAYHARRIKEAELGFHVNHGQKKSPRGSGDKFHLSWRS